MRLYEPDRIRNVGIVGHGDTGKTQLVSACLYTAGMTPRLGKVSDGSTVTDWDEEEIGRHISIQTGVAYADWTPAGNGDHTKINFLDTPGYSTFISETKASLIAADAVLIVVDATAGVQVITEKVWDFATEYDLPRVFILNRMDRELASFARAIQSLRDAYGRSVIPIQLPIGEEKRFTGVVDLVAMKALIDTPDGAGKATVAEIPAEMAEAAKAAHEALVEMVAEGDDALMQEFFDEGTLPVADLKKGLHEAVRDKRLFPVLVASGIHNIGTSALLDFMVEVLPAPVERGTSKGTSETDGHGDPVSRAVSDKEPLSLYVFKTLADAFAGRISYFKVLSGVLKNDATIQNFTRHAPERFQHLQLIQGKTATPVDELHAGDIGSVAKLRETLTGDTLGEKNAPIFYSRARLPEPLITFAVEPKTHADEDKIGTAIHRLLEEDPVLRFGRDPQTKEFLLSGAGQQHIEVVVSKLRKRFHVELTLKPPTVPYLETIRGSADAEGKHKKQSGGHGQYGVCRIKMEPLQRGGGIDFVNEIVGGAIPRNWIPSVEKGVREAAHRGVLAGFPVVDFRVRLYDGKYHDVDSSDVAFQIAGSLAFKEAVKQAHPALLEPLMHVEVHVPEQFSGTVLGDLSSRRGRISGSEARGHAVVIKAVVPLVGMLSYGTDLVSMTQGRGNFSMEFSHYDFAPQAAADKVIAAHKPHTGHEEAVAAKA
jgi:elongation factor G